MSDVRDEQSAGEASPGPAPDDPAAAAFEALREEVALVRRAVAGLAAERAAIEIPDYSETLGKILRASAATGVHLKALTEMPALRRSARDWGHEIAAAAENARRADHQALERAENMLEHQAWKMATSLESARTAARQRQLLFWTAAVACLAGVLLSVVVFATLI